MALPDPRPGSERAASAFVELCLTVLASLPVACGGEASGTTSVRDRDAEPAARTALATAEPVRHHPAWEASGVLEPSRSARLGFIVGGRLTRVEVHRGDRVDEGQVLARLDTAEVGAGIAQAQAAVAAADAQVRGAEDALQRLEKLSSEGAVAEATLVKVRLQHEAASALRSQARSALQMAQVKGGQHVLRAPFAGTVLDAPEDVGGIVGPGIPQIDLADLTRLRARISLPSEAVGIVGVDLPARVRTRGGAELEGRVALVLPALDAETHRLPVEVVVTPPEGSEGLANSYVSVRIEAGEAVEAVSVPATALVREEDTRVFVVDGGVARVRTVTVLATAEDRVVVQGIPADATVVDLPAADLRDGARVIR